MYSVTSIAVFLFSSLALLLPSGYSFGAALLLLGSAALLTRRRQRLVLERDDYWLIAAFLVYFVVCALSTIVNDSALNELDIPLRFVLAIPPFLLLRAYPPAPGAVWGGFAAGGIGAGLLAISSVAVLGLDRAAGYTNPIQYGNLSLLFGVLCLAGSGWAREQPKAGFWIALLLTGAVLGILGSILSGSRGSYIALPACLIVLYAYSERRLRRRQLTVAAAGTMLIVAATSMMPNMDIQQRLQGTVNEATGYFKSGQAANSVGGRLEMWRTGVLVALERPLFGWGKQGFMQRKKELVDAGSAHPYILEHTHAHNEYIDVMAKRGVLGLAALLLLYLAPLVLLTRQLRSADAPESRAYTIGGMLVIVCYMIFGLTQAFLTHNNGALTLALILSIMWAMKKTHPTPTSRIP